MNTVGTSRGAGDLTGAVKAVVEAAHELAAAGLVAGTSGNVSARCGEVLLVTATGARLQELEADQVTVVNLEGRVVSGELAPTSELALHLEVYRRFGAGSVVHAHPPVATALGCVLDELPCIHPDMLDLGGTVRVAPYRVFGSRAFAEVTARALSGHQAALLSNHGTVALGDDPGQAVERTRLLEWAAGLYFRSSQLGTPRVLSDAEQQELRTTIDRIGYGRTRRLDP